MDGVVESSMWPGPLFHGDPENDAEAILVSVVIPAYNAEADIGAAIASALSQSEGRLEVLVADGGSTDRTGEIVRAAAAADRRVRYVRTGMNAGLAAARNRALDMARGDWIALLDAEGRFHPRRLEKLIALAERTDADIVSDNLLLCHASGNEPDRLMIPQEQLGRETQLSSTSFFEGDIKGGKNRRRSYDLMQPLFRREVLDAQGLAYDESNCVAENFLFYVECLARGARWWVTPEPMYIHTIREDSVAQRQSVSDSTRLRNAAKRLLADPQTALDPALTRALQRHSRRIAREYRFHALIGAVRERRFGLAAQPRSGSGSFNRSRVDAAPEPVPARSMGKALTPTLYVVTVLAWLAVCGRAIWRAKDAGEDSWYAMSRALDYLHQGAGTDVYRDLFFLQHVKFQYPTSGLFWMELLRFFHIQSVYGYNLANAAVFIATCIALGFFAVQVLGTISYRGIRLPVGPAACLFASLFYPERLGLRLGQVQLVLGLLFLLACLALWNDRRFMAGCCIALAATVKPQFLPFGLLALWHRDWRFLAGLTATACAGIALSGTLYGWNSQLGYLPVLSFLSQHGEYHHWNQSIGGLLTRILYQGPSLDLDPNGPTLQSAFPPYNETVYIATTISALAMVAVPFLIPKKTDAIGQLLTFCLAAILFTMASPIAWVHHYNIFLPVFFVLLKAGLEQRTARRKIFSLSVLFVGCVLIGVPVAGQTGPTVAGDHVLQSHVFFGAMLLVGLLLYEALRRARRTLEISSRFVPRPASPDAPFMPARRLHP